MKYTISLKKNNSFKYILKKGKYVISKNLVIYVIPNKNKKENILGICVNKKHGISVHRNKMKRWVREVYKNEEEKIKKGYSIVILYKKGITINELDYMKVYKDITFCFERLDLYEK